MRGLAGPLVNVVIVASSLTVYHALKDVGPAEIVRCELP